MAITGIDTSLAASILRKGDLVAIPTETVYGLAANALDTNAVIKIFETKNRPLFDPLILHIPSFDHAVKYADHIPDLAKRLAEKFCPGPLTMLLDKSSIIPDLVTSGLPQVAIRVPNHSLTLDLLNKIDFPLAAPSANPFGYISPTTAAHVNEQLGNKIEYILDGGSCEVGVESTIVGFEENKIIVYRLGGLPIEALKDFAEVELRVNQSSNPKAPGQLKSHYAPRKTLYLGNVDELLNINSDKKIAILSFSKRYEGLNKQLSPAGDMNEAAHNLFAYMRELDASDAEIIIAEKFPDTFLGRAINDRLERAAAK